MIKELEKSIDLEIEMTREISKYFALIPSARSDEKKLIESEIAALKESIKIINRTIPDLLNRIPYGTDLPEIPVRKKELTSVKVERLGKNIEVPVRPIDKEKLLKELSISEQLIKRFKKVSRAEKEDFYEFKASRGYLKMSNRFFLNAANRLIEKDYFKSLFLSLKQANVDILFESYVAMMLFTLVIAVASSVLIVLISLFIDTSPIWPFFEVYRGSILDRLTKTFWIPLILPLIIFITLYIYPSTEKKSLEKRINQELPFAVIHMSAISGSGIEPSKIFKIIGLSKEYPYLRKEIRKVMNQINLYGYDLTTALNNASRTAPSENLAELFAGLSTTITSGANLSEFFEKRAESLLLSYRIEREKYTHLVETFLDIYISIVIAAPMVFLLLLIMMAVSGINIALSPLQMSLLVVVSIALLNFIFLIFLQIKQPSY